MTDYASDIPSTVIDTDPSPSAAGGGAPNLTEPVEQKPDAPLSLREDIEAAFKEDKAEKPEKVEPKADEPKGDDKAPDKPKVEEKAKEEAPKDDKAAAEPEAKKDEATPKAEAKPEEKQQDAKFHEPPKKFLPDSREVWRNVPRAVRRDIDTLVQEHESERQRFSEVSQRYDRIRDFDELAQRNGRDLRESLTKIHQVETMMQQNPVAGLNAILMEAGPRKPDGQPYSLFEVAQAIVQKGQQGYHQMVAQQPRQQQQPQENQRVAQLEAELRKVQDEQIRNSVIEPFKASHPRFDELKDDIAFFLQSGKISQSLSHVERLAAAYDMAVRINPASRVEEKAAANEDTGPDQTLDRRADPDFSGSKSIKNSPGSVSEEVEDEAKSGESVRDSIRFAARRMNRA